MLKWECFGGCRRGCAGLVFVPFGAVAQLGERLDRTQEVRGSSPLSSMRTGAWCVVADGGVGGLSYRGSSIGKTAHHAPRTFVQCTAARLVSRAPRRCVASCR